MKLTGVYNKFWAFLNLFFYYFSLRKGCSYYSCSSQTDYINNFESLTVFLLHLLGENKM